MAVFASYKLLLLLMFYITGFSLEVVEDDHDEAREAAEGERVGPEAPRLELTRARADVD